MKLLKKRIKAFWIAACVLPLSGCFDTQIKLDLREPDQSVLEFNTLLKPSALDMIKLSNPSLVHGDLAERGKQLRTCQLFFSNDDIANNVFSKTEPVTIGQILYSKNVEYDGNNLNCGFTGVGPANEILAVINRSEMFAFKNLENRYEINIDTKASDFSRVSDLDFFGFSKQDTNPPLLNLVIIGHDLKSNFDAGNINSTRFELQEKLMGKRDHFQTDFTISVKSESPSLFDHLNAAFNEFKLWLTKKISQFQSETA